MTEVERKEILDYAAECYVNKAMEGSEEFRAPAFAAVIKELVSRAFRDGFKAGLIFAEDNLTKKN